MTAQAAAHFLPGDRVVSPSGAAGVVYETTTPRPDYAVPMPIQVCRVMIEGANALVHLDARTLAPASPKGPRP